MKYVALLWPHANVRYRSETLKLAQAELDIMLARVAPEIQVSSTQILGMRVLELESEDPLSEDCLRALGDHSLLYGIFAQQTDGALCPVQGRSIPYLGEDLPGILKYKGKTNEMFTQLLMNVALYAGDYWKKDGTIRLLDPMCGRGTTLFLGANRRWDCTGSDVGKNDLREAEGFFKRYLEYHRLKHSITRSSLTVQGGKPSPCVRFVFSDTAEHYKSKETAELRMACTDAAKVTETFGRGAFHLIVCDLPYGVQHGAHGASLDRLLEKLLPNWKDALKPGGTVGVAFNAQTLPRKRVLELMAQAGLQPMQGEAYEQFDHWVEQAVTRDIAIGRK
jgi:SAM-dependent methyltransferase